MITLVPAPMMLSAWPVRSAPYVVANETAVEEILVIAEIWKVNRARVHLRLRPYSGPDDVADVAQ